MNCKDAVQCVPGDWRTELKFQVLINHEIQYSVVQLFVLSGHYLVIVILKKVGRADIRTSIAVFCLLGHQCEV